MKTDMAWSQQLVSRICLSLPMLLFINQVTDDIIKIWKLDKKNWECANCFKNNIIESVSCKLNNLNEVIYASLATDQTCHQWDRPIRQQIGPQIHAYCKKSPTIFQNF